MAGVPHLAAVLAYAAKAAADVGLTNAETLETDGEQLAVGDGSFDAVISRVGLIHFPDQHAALGGMRAALRPAAGCRVLRGRPQRLLLGTGGIIRRRAAPPPPAPRAAGTADAS